MNVSRFCAPDMRQAIRLVRESLGPEAVIISNRKVAEGIEIIAAVDYDESLFPAFQTPRETAPAREEPPALEDDRYTPAAAPAASGERDAVAAGTDADAAGPAFDAMQAEIHALRGLLENQLAHLAWKDLKQRAPVRANLLGNLERMHLDRDLIRTLTERAAQAADDDQAWQTALAELAATLPVAEGDLIDGGGIFALVGSTGVGKTTTVAKLAARYVLRYGHRHIGLVTTDSYRIGAYDQLVSFGRILGIPVQVAGDAEELRSILRSLSDKRVVLIDTAGMSQRDRRLHHQLTTLAETGMPIRTLLVMSATAQRSILDETVQAFRGAAPAGVIVTKLDEAASLGELLSVIVKKHLPLTFLADGQRVPEDLHVARAADLVKRATALSRADEGPEDSAMAERYGEVRADAVV